MVFTEIMANLISKIDKNHPIEIKISAYKLNKLIQDYPLLKDYIDSVKLISDFYGDMSKKTILQVIFKKILDR